jgi:hypothetical protein
MNLAKAPTFRRWAALVAAYAVLAQVLIAMLAPLAQARQAEAALFAGLICHSDTGAADGGAPAGPHKHAQDCCLSGGCCIDAASARSPAVVVAPAPVLAVALVGPRAAGPVVNAAPERDGRQSRAPPALS